MEDNGEHQVELKGPLMWRDPPNQSMSSLPFKIGDLFDMFEQRPLYFTASQVRHWIEYFAPTLREWLKDLAETELYEPFYDLCQCDYKSMWDTLDTMLHLLWKYEDENKPYAGRDAVEHTAFYAGRIARAIAAVGFLFDIPEEDLVVRSPRDNHSISTDHILGSIRSRIYLRNSVLASLSCSDGGFAQEQRGMFHPNRLSFLLPLFNETARPLWCRTPF
jgi:hypothetical protein